MQLRKMHTYARRPFAVPKRRFSLYAVGWYLAPYELLALLVGLTAYGVIGRGHAAGVVGTVAFVVASVVGCFRVLPRADWTGGFGFEKDDQEALARLDGVEERIAELDESQLVRVEEDLAYSSARWGPQGRQIRQLIKSRRKELEAIASEAQSN